MVPHELWWEGHRKATSGFAPWLIAVFEGFQAESDEERKGNACWKRSRASNRCGEAMGDGVEALDAVL